MSKKDNGGGVVATSTPIGVSLRRIGLEWIAAGLGCAIADSAMNPLEIMKVRLQAKGGSGSALSISRLFTEGKTIIGKEGLYGFYVPGLMATSLRGFFYAGFRIGMYPMVRNNIQNTLNKSGDNFVVKLCAGAITGAVGSFIFTPIDVVRTRFQKNPNAYPSTPSAFGLIFRQEGISGLWSGGTASVTRSAMLSGVQLATYETFKRAIVRKLGFEDTVRLQVCASIFSGIVAQAVIMPVDTIKTRLMIAYQQPDLPANTKLNMLSSAKMLIKEGGVTALYRGFVPAIARQAPCMLIQMPVIEQLRRILGVGYL